jgi:hypothetical protein
MSLAEYAARYGITEPPAQAAPMPSYEDRRGKYTSVEKQKADILQELDQGTDNESILFLALRALADATGDPAFLEKARPFLNGDTEVKSLFIDLDEMQAKRQERRRKYFDKRRKDIQKQVKQLEADRQELMREMEKIPVIAE